MTTRRLAAAMAIYVGIALAGLTVEEEKLRLALWIFTAGLAVKTYIAWLQARKG